MYARTRRQLGACGHGRLRAGPAVDGCGRPASSSRMRSRRAFESPIRRRAGAGEASGPDGPRRAVPRRQSRPGAASFSWRNGQRCFPAGTTSSLLRSPSASPACGGPSSSAWRRCTSGRAPSVSSGSSTSWTTASSTVARLRDDSHRTMRVPDWLSALVTDHVARRHPQPCPCHGGPYVFGGYRLADHAPRQPGPKLVDVADRAGVSVGTVSNVLNRPDIVEASKREVVDGTPAAHWRRNGFATWLFQPAAKGWYPAKAPAPARPVPVSAAPWRGVPIRGRNAAGRAEACWMPIARGLTSHGCGTPTRRSWSSWAPSDADGRQDGPLGWLDASALRARHVGHGAPAPRRADPGVDRGARHATLHDPAFRRPRP